MGEILETFADETYRWYRRGRIVHAWEPRQRAYKALILCYGPDSVRRHQARVKAVLDATEALEAWRGTCATGKTEVKP